MKPIIRIDNLGKRYPIGASEPRYATLRESVMAALKAPVRSLLANHHDKPSTDQIWALKNVSFAVLPGEVVGVIGRNGAGKTTLLKILGRITEPTTGLAELYGRVGSLLEVGTGFHSELTGRENVYLSGAILGMNKKEIERKFDEIVAFAEVEKFLDTPLKHYSSGMYVRLAFAVAGHLEPEILLVDEVLAMGDAAFQKKCLGRMGEVAKQGRTVLFVSHNLAMVRTLCSRGILLEEGQIKMDGSAAQAVNFYSRSLDTIAIDEGQLGEQISSLAPDPQFRLISLRLFQENSTPGEFVSHQPIGVEIAYEVREALHGLRVGFDLWNQEGVQLFRTFDDDDPSASPEDRSRGKHISRCEIPGDFLAPGRYTLSLAIGVHMLRWIVYDSIKATFLVRHIAGVNSHYADPRPGALMPLLHWERHES